MLPITLAETKLLNLDCNDKKKQLTSKDMFVEGWSEDWSSLDFYQTPGEEVYFVCPQTIIPQQTSQKNTKLV